MEDFVERYQGGYKEIWPVLTGCTDKEQMGKENQAPLSIGIARNLSWGNPLGGATAAAVAV